MDTQQIIDREWANTEDLIRIENAMHADEYRRYREMIEYHCRLFGRRVIRREPEVLF